MSKRKLLRSLSKPRSPNPEMPSSRPLTVGTAGHVDHGKSALVKALTGKDTDRLAEEARRGISIELGFAELNLDGRHMSLIDVPGHERFVRTMIAGASGIDMFLMVIAADDGVMPQTREHLSVLRALGLDNGVVAVTKCDLASTVGRNQTIKAAGELLPDAPIVAVRALGGEGIDELRRQLAAVAAQVDGEGDEEPRDNAPAVLHVDRVFTVAGRGTVITGTLWSGHITRNQRLTVHPGGRETRVREIQVHDRQLDEAQSRQRVALNVAGLDRNEIGRGDVIASNDSGLKPTFRIDVELWLEQQLARHERVQIHHGTREVPARVYPLRERFTQLRLEGPLLAQAGDRFVIRRIGPPSTIGGGRVIDAAPARHGPGAAVDRLFLVRDGNPEAILEAVLSENGAGLPIDPTTWRLIPRIAPSLHRFPRERWHAAMASLVSQGKAFEINGSFLPPKNNPAKCHDGPQAKGSIAEDSLAQIVRESLRADGRKPRTLYTLAAAVGRDPSEVLAALQQLVEAGDAVRVKPKLYYGSSEMADLRDQIVGLIEQRGPISIAEVRDALDIGRQHAQAVLEYLDASKITLRRGDRRILRRRPSMG